MFDEVKLGALVACGFTRSARCGTGILATRNAHQGTNPPPYRGGNDKRDVQIVSLLVDTVLPILVGIVTTAPPTPVSGPSFWPRCPRSPASCRNGSSRSTPPPSPTGAPSTRAERCRRCHRWPGA